jgi:RNA polymerase sigma-70 factor (ECF subfamily)
MWPDSDSTRELLDRLAQADDPAAAERLWARHREPLRRMIAMRLDHAIGRRVDASDVVQDVLIEASRRLSGYLRDPSMPFHLWLRQIARDRMIDEHRRHRVAARRNLDRERSLAAPEYADRSGFDLAAGLRDSALTPAAASLRRELEWRFRIALDDMDEADREILLMRHFEGLSNSEAARALNLSEPAAGMRHLRALRRLRERLGEAPSL